MKARFPAGWVAPALLLVGSLGLSGWPASGKANRAMAEEAKKDASPYDRQIHLAYTINNFGYVDTCG